MILYVDGPWGGPGAHSPPFLPAVLWEGEPPIFTDYILEYVTKIYLKKVNK